MRGRRPADGELGFALPSKAVRRREEIALTISLISQRQRFGYAYRELQPDYFEAMPRDAGVYCTVVVPTALLTTKLSMPGDIDLLIVPYEGSELVLHRTLAVEIKAVRASYARQGKSPNEMGVSQARGLLAMGFPYVALGHLIVAAESPMSIWRRVGVARVLDCGGRAELLEPILTDTLPGELMERSFGRISALSPAEIGLLAAFIAATEEELTGAGEQLSIWLPLGRPASRNTLQDNKLLERIAQLFEQHPEAFLDNPRYDPA